VHSIRAATIKDIPLIRELTYKVWPQTYLKIQTQEQVDYMLEMMYSVSALEKQMNDGCEFIIAYDDKEPVGFASYQDTGDNIYKLHKLYVLISQQGKGTGRFIIDYLCREIKQKKGKALHLQVNRFNTAKDFYNKLGFAVIAEQKLDIGNGFFMDDYIMEKKL